MNYAQPEFTGFPASQIESAAEPIAHRFLRLSGEKGTLIPQEWIRDVLGVSRARAYQFVSEGRFEIVEVGNISFVSLSELEAFKAAPRATGRPKKETK